MVIPAGPGGGVENWSGAGPQGLAPHDWLPPLAWPRMPRMREAGRSVEAWPGCGT